MYHYNYPEEFDLWQVLVSGDDEQISWLLRVSFAPQYQQHGCSGQYLETQKKINALGTYILLFFITCAHSWFFFCPKEINYKYSWVSIFYMWLFYNE